MKTLVTIVLSLAGIFPASGAGQAQAGVGRASSLDMLLPAVSQLPEESSEDARPTRFLGEAGAKKEKSPKPQSILYDSSNSPCMMKYDSLGIIQAKFGWAAEYDSNKSFVENCYTNRFATAGITGSDDIVQYGGLGPAPGCWEQNLQWLLTLFPMRQDANWFCSIVNAVAGSLMNQLDTTYQQMNTGTNRSMSVIYWINNNPLCANHPDTDLYNNGRRSQILLWLEQDTSKVPLDTTIYSMHDLGLDSVLKYAGLLGVHEPGMASIISNASAYPNPTGEGTVVSFGVSKEAYVIIRLFDVLGHDVTVSGFGGVVQPGNLSVPLSLQGLPAGTYYARIQTTYGEVQTVKLVKE